MNPQILQQLKPLLRSRGLVSQKATPLAPRRLPASASFFASYSGSSGSGGGGGGGGKEAHRLFEEQMRDLQEEREILFGFTEADRSAWTNAGGSAHRHEPSFLQEIDSARHSALKRNDATDPTVSVPTAVSNDEDADLPSTPTASSFSHVSSDGSSVRMVDVGAKSVSHRTAVAQSRVVFPPEVVQAFQIQGSDLVGSKGPIFATAKIAGIMAAK